MQTLLVGILVIVAAAGAERRPDHTAWNQIVSKYVNAESRVDYKALKANEVVNLDRYLYELLQAWPKDMTPAEMKAELINAYNAFTVRYMMTNYPTESIWRTDHPYSAVRHELNGGKYSLEQIAARLREMGDPRINGALACPALSCPPLRHEAYDAATLDAQLDDNVRVWLADPKLNEFLPDAHRARVSMIFKWHEADFTKNGGSVASFLGQYGPAGKADFLKQPGGKIGYLPFNWGINDVSDLGLHYSKYEHQRDKLRERMF